MRFNGRLVMGPALSNRPPIRGAGAVSRYTFPHIGRSRAERKKSSTKQPRRGARGCGFELHLGCGWRSELCFSKSAVSTDNILTGLSFLGVNLKRRESFVAVDCERDRMSIACWRNWPTDSMFWSSITIFGQNEYEYKAIEMIDKSASHVR